MARRLHALTSDGVNAINSGLARANNNPLGRRGAKAERRVFTTSGDTYKGYFKAIDVSDAVDQKIKIVDGFSDNYDTETSAGLLQINKFNFDLPSHSFVITTSSIIYIESILVGDPVTSATAELKLTTFPTLAYESGKEKTIVSRIAISGGKIKKISQENVNPRIFIIGEC